ncbi:MAG: hypothetical protein KJ592_03510 [Nanoarchaeota archaeon]|nr:hypothetical protein [Nanoarchaeota archaeon]
MKKKSQKITPWKFATAAASTVAILIFITTIVALTNLIGPLPIITSLISEMYGMLGYSTSIIGAILGAIYGFIDTFISAYIFAWIYNKLI